MAAMDGGWSVDCSVGYHRRETFLQVQGSTKETPRDGWRKEGIYSHPESVVGPPQE